MSPPPRPRVRPCVLALAFAAAALAGPPAAGQTTDVVAVETDHALAVAYSPDGRLLAGAGFAKAVQVWDARTGRLRHALEGPTRTSRRCVAFLPDGHSLAAGGDDGIVRVWDLRTGALARSLTVASDKHLVIALAVAPDGRALAATASRPGQGERAASVVQVLDLRTGKARWSRPGDQWVYDVAFAPDGKTLAAADGVVRLLDAGTGAPLRNLQVKDRLALKVAFAPDGRTVAGAGGHWIAVGGGTQQVSEAFLWEARTGELCRRLTDLQPWLRCLAFAPDGKMLATGSSGPIRHHRSLTWVTSEVRLWDPHTGRLLRRIEGEMGDVNSVAFAPDGRSLLSCDEQTVALTETSTGLRRLTLMTRKDGVISRTAAAPVSASDPPADLARGWADLAGTDGAAAYRAMGYLADRPAESVPYLAERLRPVAGVPRRRVDELITALGSDQFAARQRAQQELEALQDLAEEALHHTLVARPTLEVRRRIDRLLERMDLLNAPDRLRSLRAIEVLESIGTPPAAAVLRRLAAGAPEARQTREAKASLDRLARHRPAP